MTQVCFKLPNDKQIAQGAEFSELACGGVKSGERFRGVNNIMIRFEARQGYATLPADVEPEEHLLVANYAWDANAFPGYLCPCGCSDYSLSVDVCAEMNIGMGKRCWVRLAIPPQHVVATSQSCKTL